MQREVVRRQGRGQGRVKVGKDPLDFSFYLWLGDYFLSNSDHHHGHIFAHSFGILCWNLMARAGNVISICWNHLRWDEDSLAIYFAHQKNDQAGSKPRDPRHVYANPIMPAICPILSLGIYFLCFPDIFSHQYLFQGSQQYARYRQILTKLVQEGCGARELADRGMADIDLGTHSFRKGAATFASSGTTDAPSAFAIHLRAGWAMQGVQGTYLRYSKAGDQHVGRTVAGLPSDRAEFAILPPFFPERDEEVRNLMASCFPVLPNELRRVVEFCLASVVYHSTWLQEHLPERHRLRFTRLFTTAGLLERLCSKVKCKLWEPGDPIRATGITNHTATQLELRAMRSQFELLPHQVVDGVASVLEENSVNAGQVTRNGLKDMLQNCLTDAGLPHAVGQLNLLHPVATSSNGQSSSSESGIQQQQVPPDSSPDGFPPYAWGGRFHLVPEGYQLPTGGILVAWQHYVCGDTTDRIPPLRRLSPQDLSDRNQRKRLSDLKFLMKELVQRAKDRQIWPEDDSQLSLESANHIYNQVKSAIPAPDYTAGGRRRRPGTATWRTAVDTLRIYKRQRQDLAAFEQQEQG